MRRHVLNVLVIVGTLWLGVVTISRGQVGLGACFLGLGVLRACMLRWGRKPSKLKPELRLDIMKPSTLRYPKLPPALRSQLDLITPSVDGDLKYFPCLVRLNNGTEVDRVYLVSES